METSSSVLFEHIGIDDHTRAILEQKKIIHPTPIQQQAIPPILEGGDCIGIAQTGTGKTLAFLLPLMQLLQQNNRRALIVVPTRELAQQIHETCRWFEKKFKIYSTVIIGGASMPRQIQELKRKPRIIIATPGRLIDHVQQKTVNLSDVGFIVCDEADRMFDMGFEPQIKQIFQQLPAKTDRQTVLFSATLSNSIADVVMHHMNTPVRIEISVPGTVTAQVQQEVIIIDSAHRKEALIKLLEQEKGTKLIFTRTKHQAKSLTQFLHTKKYKVEEIHGNRSQGQRMRAMKAIHSGRANILVATDIAARGIDIDNISLVVNFELPDNVEDYVHRIGRTGRGSKNGRAVSIVLADQQYELQAIQRFINKKIEVTEISGIPTAQLQPGAPKKKSGGRGGYGGRSRSGGSSSSSRNSGSGKGYGARRSTQSKSGYGSKNRSGGGGGHRRSSRTA